MRLFVILFITCCLIVLSLSASELDSLKLALKSAEASGKPAILIQIASLLQKKEPDTALQYAIEAEQLAQAGGQLFETAAARKLQGNFQYQKKNYPAALKLYEAALGPARTNALKAKRKALGPEQSIADQKLLGDIYNNLGQTCLQLKDYPTALKHLQNSLQSRRSLPEREDEIASLHNLGLVYWEMQQFRKAAQYFKQAAHLLDNTNNVKLAATIWNNLGNAYSKIGETNEALDAYIRSLRLKEGFGAPQELAAAHVNLGNLFYLIKDYEKAIEHYTRAQTLYRQIRDDMREAQIISNLGVVYNEIKDYPAAINNYK